ncbi:MAG: SAM-dependent methyltransferase [Candidatus Nitrosocosmicus sp.]|nr:SAM-dependent methyltransferase [Candidatus Nitrosocosmicus sp.]
MRYAKRDAQLYDAAKLDRLEIYEILKDSTRSGKLAIRFHDGDPTIFSTIREQIDRLEKDEIECNVVPGITSLLGQQHR